MKEEAEINRKLPPKLMMLSNWSGSVSGCSGSSGNGVVVNGALTSTANTPATAKTINSCSNSNNTMNNNKSQSDEILSNLLRMHNCDSISSIKDESLDIDLSACVTITADPSGIIGSNSLSSSDFWRIMDENTQTLQLHIDNAVSPTLLANTTTTTATVDDTRTLCGIKKLQTDFTGTFLRPEVPTVNGMTFSPLKRNVKPLTSPMPNDKVIKFDIKQLREKSPTNVTTVKLDGISWLPSLRIHQPVVATTIITSPKISLNNNTITTTATTVNSINTSTKANDDTAKMNEPQSQMPINTIPVNVKKEDNMLPPVVVLDKLVKNDCGVKSEIQAPIKAKVELFYKCIDCNGKLFQDHQELIRNHVTHHVQYKCSACEKEYDLETSFKKHLKIHRPAGNNGGGNGDARKDAWKKCPDCGKCLKLGSMWMHRKIHADTKKYGCDICGQKFVQKINLTQHIRIHTAEKPFECSECHKRFQERSHLQRHQKYHAQTRSYRCDKCGKMYKTERCLKVHNLVHLEKRPFACDRCDKSFISNSKLKQHSNIHTGERPFKCNYCTRDFTNFPNWLKHTRRRHKVDHKTGEILENIPTYCSKKSSRAAKEKKIQSSNKLNTTTTTPITLAVAITASTATTTVTTTTTTNGRPTVTTKRPINNIVTVAGSIVANTATTTTILNVVTCAVDTASPKAAIITTAANTVIPTTNYVLMSSQGSNAIAMTASNNNHNQSLNSKIIQKNCSNNNNNNMDLIYNKPNIQLIQCLNDTNNITTLPLSAERTIKLQKTNENGNNVGASIKVSQEDTPVPLQLAKMPAKRKKKLSITQEKQEQQQQHHVAVTDKSTIIKEESQQHQSSKLNLNSQIDSGDAGSSKNQEKPPPLASAFNTQVPTPLIVGFKNKSPKTMQRETVKIKRERKQSMPKQLQKKPEVQQQQQQQQMSSLSSPTTSISKIIVTSPTGTTCSTITTTTTVATTAKLTNPNQQIHPPLIIKKEYIEPSSITTSVSDDQVNRLTTTDSHHGNPNDERIHQFQIQQQQQQQQQNDNIVEQQHQNLITRNNHHNHNFPELHCLSITSAEELLMEEALEWEECMKNGRVNNDDNGLIGSSFTDTDNALSSDVMADFHFKIKQEHASDMELKFKTEDVKEFHKSTISSSLESSPFSSPASLIEFTNNGANTHIVNTKIHNNSATNTTDFIDVSNFYVPTTFIVNNNNRVNNNRIRNRDMNMNTNNMTPQLLAAVPELIQIKTNNKVIDQQQTWTNNTLQRVIITTPKQSIINPLHLPTTINNNGQESNGAGVNGRVTTSTFNATKTLPSVDTLLFSHSKMSSIYSGGHINDYDNCVVVDNVLNKISRPAATANAQLYQTTLA